MGNGVLLFNACGERASDLSVHLAHCGFAVRVVASLDGAVRAVRENAPALIVIWCSDQRPVEPCVALRSTSQTPIVAVTTSRDEKTVVALLNAGADTVLSMPCSRREFGARIGSVLGARFASRPEETARSTFRVGSLVVDTKRRLATTNDRSLYLTSAEFRVLVALARRQGSVVSSADLACELPDGDAHTIRQNIRYLRRKLNGSPAIETRRGVGYRLAEVSRIHE